MSSKDIDPYWMIITLRNGKTIRQKVTFSNNSGTDLEWVNDPNAESALDQVDYKEIAAIRYKLSVTERSIEQDKRVNAWADATGMADICAAFDSISGDDSPERDFDAELARARRTREHIHGL